MTERAQAIERLRREKRALVDAGEARQRRLQEAIEQAHRDGAARGTQDALALPYTALERHGAAVARRRAAAPTPVAHQTALPELPREVAEAAFAYEREHHVASGPPESIDFVSGTGPLATAFGEGWREAVGRFWDEVKDAL